MPTPLRSAPLVAALLALSACVTPAPDAPPLSKAGTLSVGVDNDVWTGSDNSYTNGVALSWTTPEVPPGDRDGFVGTWVGLADALPVVGDADAATYASWTIGQEMHTPNDLTDPDPPTDDQPYAGVLFVDAFVHARRGRWGHGWGLRLGVVGPSSHADDAQREWHELIGEDLPQGWDTQLPDEPLVNLSYTASYDWLYGELGDRAAWRVVPLGRVELGNYFTGAGLVTYGEAGWNLPREAAGSTALRQGLAATSTVGPRPDAAWSLSAFGGGGGYGVLHYLPLDGTVFSDSRSVDSNPFIGFLTWGAALRWQRLSLSVGQSLFSETFDTQRERTEFGTLGISWSF